MALMKNEFNKENVRELAKKIDEKHIVVSIQFTLKLNKALSYPEFFTKDDAVFMLNDLKSRFIGVGKVSNSSMFYDINEMISFVNSIKEVLKKKELIL